MKLKRECPKCGKEFQTEKLLGVCPSCALLALAVLMEETDPGDSLRDISSGEQIGAWLRDGIVPDKKGGAK